MYRKLCCQMDSADELCASCTRRLQVRASLKREELLIEKLDALAEEFVESLAPISHWGGGKPYDGVLEGLEKRIRFILKREESADGNDNS